MDKNYSELLSEKIELVNSTKSAAKLKLREKFKKEEWFFSFDGLPNNWKQVNILDVTWLVTCGVAKKPEYVDEGIPFLSAQNARPFKANLNKIKYITQEQFETLTVGGKPELNDILYTRVGNCGEAAKVIFDFDFGVYVSLTLIKPIHELINTDYLVAFLNSHYGLTQANVGAIGSGLKNLNVNNVRKYKIPLPPLAEQQRIVAKLDDLFGHLEQVKTRLEKIPDLLKNFRQAILTQAVTGQLTEEWREGKKLVIWKEMELQEFANVIDPQPSHRTPPIHEDSIPYVSIKDVDKNGNVDLTNARPVSKEVLKEHINRYDLQEGDFGFGKIGTLGKPFFLPIFEDRRYTLSANIILIQPRRECLAKFIFYYLDSPIIEKKLKEGANSTSQPAFGIKKARVFPTPKVSLEEQSEIVSRVESLFAKSDAIEDKYNTLKAQIDSLPQAILAKAFKGELVEQLPTDGNAAALLEEIQKMKAELAPKKKKMKKQIKLTKG